MDLPVKIDFSRLELPSAASLLIPVVPGSVLLMTLWYFHGEAAARFFAIAYVGYGTKLVFISFASYSAGLIISVLTEIGLGLLAILIIHLPGRYFTKRLSTGVWQSSAFRKLAVRFLGNLAPPDELPMSDAVYELELKKCEQQGDPLGSVNRKIEVLKERGRLDRMDYEWHRWYDVLRRYFQPIPSPPQASIYMVRASASAAAVWLFILYSEAYPVTSPFVAGWVLLVVGLIQEVSLLGFSHYPDITGEDMLARMLQEVKLQEMKADKERSESAGINRQEVGDARGK